MADFAIGILASIRNDQEFKFNPVVMAVVENLESKRASYQTEEDFLSAVKESLAGVNAYMKNKRIEDILVKIDEKLGAAADGNINIKIRRMYYEADIPAAVDAIRNSAVYSEPVVKNYVDNAMVEMQTRNVPYFKYLPGFIGVMATYRNNEVVNEWVTKFENYIKDNGKKLMMLEVVHYLDGIGNGFYHGVTEKLKPFIVKGEFNSSKIMLEMKEFATVPVLKDMFIALQATEANETKQFHLGTGDGNTRVYNYIGPVLKEESNMVFFADGCFINLTGKVVEEKNIERVLGKSGEITVQELKPEYVYESMGEYYQVAKSFEYLNFKMLDRGVSTRLRNISVDFKVNESGNLDLFVNSEKIEDPKKVNFHQMFVLENNYVKNCSSILFNSIDKIYNVEFIKMLVNESKNAAAIIINVNEDYYVYDFVDAKKRDIYKTDGFGLQKFVFEKFNYDVRALFDIQINDVKGKVNSIDEKKREIEGALAKLEESHKTLSDTIAKDGIKASDKELLKGLLEKVEKEIVTLKNAYILLEDERSITLGQRPQTQAPESYKMGDNVSFGDRSGRIVAVPSDDKSETYMVYTTEGRTEKVEKKDMSKSQAQEGQAQKTNESKKEEGQAQDDDKKKDDKDDKKKDDKKKDDKEAQSQSQSQSQESQAQTQSQEAQQAQQGIVPDQTQQSEPDNSPKEKEAFKKVSGELGELRSAIDTVRPEVREKFQDLATDLDTLVKQAGELERLRDEMKNIKGVSDKVDFAKADKKFDKIMGELENVTKDLTVEFGKGAQQVVVSESLIASAYDKYIGVVSSVADKLTGKVSNIVKKLSGDLIDLDADVKVLNARAYAAKAKDELGTQQAPKGEIPTAGAQPAAQAAQAATQPAQAAGAAQAMQDQAQQSVNPPQSSQTQAQQNEPPQSGQTQAQHQAQEPTHQAQETQAQQAQEHNDDFEKKLSEGFYTQDNLNKLTNEDLASEYSKIFQISEEQALEGIIGNKETYITEILSEYEAIMKSRK